MTNESPAAPHAEPTPHTKYRPDIDGLRAIAIISVIGFHAFPLWVKGGFIGVDIFFVISGFLISTIIFNGLSHNTFSFVEFYSRRVNRIFPALLLVLVACFTFGWFALMADEYKQLGKHITGGLGFISNFLFWNESGYFDNAADVKPLLHLWSLAIEEQFYLVWPLLLWCAWKQKLNWLKLTLFITIISFILNVRGVRTDAVAAFYSPQTRFWELLVGSLLAYKNLYNPNAFSNLKNKIDLWLEPILYSQPQNEKGNSLRNAMSLLGLASIIFGLIRITKNGHYPGTWALVPTLGTAMIISAGPSAWINRKILSARVLVWVGLISYPLYLWHWPLLSFARIVESDTPSRNIRIVAVMLSIVLAWLTYNLIEKPLRFSKLGNIKTIALLLLMIVIGGIGQFAYQKNGLPFRATISHFAEEFTVIDFDAQKFRASDGSCEKYGFQYTDNVVCMANSSAPNVLIVGDSHALALGSAVYLNKTEFPIKSLSIAQHGCLPFSNLTTNTNCLAYFDSLKFAKLESVKQIFINARGPLYLTGVDISLVGIKGAPVVPFHYRIQQKELNNISREQLFLEGYSELISELLKLGKQVIFIIDVPESLINAKSCFSPRPFSSSDNLPLNCTVSKKMEIERQSNYRNIIQKLKSENPKLVIYDTFQNFCDETSCFTKLNNRLLYFDSDHVSTYGSKLILDSISKQIPKQ